MNYLEQEKIWKAFKLKKLSPFISLLPRLTLILLVPITLDPMANTNDAPTLPIRLGVIGLGNFGRLHAETAMHLAELDLVAVVDVEEERLSAFESSIGKWTSVRAALSESDAEAWVVASPGDTHISFSKRILASGKSVLVEKPLASDLESARSLEDTIATSPGHLMMGHIVLFNSEFRSLRREIEGRGPITFLDFVRHRPAATIAAFPNEDPFHLTMIHDLYIALALKPGEDPVEISARCERNASGDYNLALADLRWSDGTRARFAASFLTPPGMGSDGFDRLEVFGKGWSARISPNPRPFELFTESAEWPTALEIYHYDNFCSGMLAEELRHFARVVAGTASIPDGATFEDALRIHGWIEEMIAQTGIGSSD